LLAKFFTLKNILLIAVNALLIIAFIVCLSVSSSIRTSLRSQQAASAWTGQSGERFAQISAFFPGSVSFDESSIFQLRDSIDRALVGASLESEPGRTLYTDAWSAEGYASVLSMRSPTPARVKVIGVGGDFFLFHPFFLRDGSYLSPDDVMKDRVVIDEELAWRLFGAVRVAGFEIMIDNVPFIVAGVIARESDFASEKAYTYEASLFMSFEALNEMMDGEARINCYEIVLADPITGFAYSTLGSGLSGSDIVIVENSSRFSFSNTFSAIRSFGERSIQTNAIAFPYWENAARYAEDWLALILALTFIFALFPLICGIVYAVKLIRFGIRQLIKLIKKLIEKKDKKDYEKYLLKHGEALEEDYDLEDIIREVNGND